jgi:transposase-like protein
MVRRRPRGKTVLRCPQCGSDRLVYNAAMITGQVYHCLACDYIGSLVLETELPVEKDPAPG